MLHFRSAKGIHVENSFSLKTSTLLSGLYSVQQRLTIPRWKSQGSISSNYSYNEYIEI